jgi:hypothetical protein
MADMEVALEEMEMEDTVAQEAEEAILTLIAQQEQNIIMIIMATARPELILIGIQIQVVSQALMALTDILEVLKYSRVEMEIRVLLNISLNIPKAL